MNRNAIKSIGQQLEGNSYPGRGIIIGMTPDSRRAVTAYFIMGRSPNSRNRVFSESDGCVRTQPFDLSKVEDPSLIIYPAVCSLKNHLIITNGDQTDTIFESLSRGESFEDALSRRCFEPDGPNWTPRISGLLTFRDGCFSYRMSILKAADAAGSACYRFYYHYAPVAGTGHFIHTYACDGNPLPSFRGEPKAVLIPEDIDTFTRSVWDALDADNRISLYVRYTDPASGESVSRMINKNTEGGTP